MTKAMRSDVPVSYLHECLTLCEGGVLTWKVRPASHFGAQRAHAVWNCRYAGKQAGWVDARGARHLAFVIGGKAIGTHAHRVVWAMTTGEWPSSEIDHADGDPSNNSPANLRLATRAQNLANTKRRSDNTSGFKGVFEYAPGKWRAWIKREGKRRHLGVFATAEAASAAYASAARQSSGAFARW